MDIRSAQIVRDGVVVDSILVPATAKAVSKGARLEWEWDGIDAPEGSSFSLTDGAQIGWVRQGSKLVAPPAPPAPEPAPAPTPSTRRVDIFMRCSEDEAARLSQGIDTASARSREIVNATMRYTHDGEAFSLLKEIAEDVFSATPKRVTEILAPSEV